MGNSIDTKYYGFRVYEIIPGGPIDESKSVIELEDFIIPPERIDKKIEFSKYLHKNKNFPISINVYNIKTRSIRQINVTPKHGWTNDEKAGLLGVYVRYENWALAHKNVLRIIKVKHNSIFEKAKVIPKDDYIVGIKRIDTDIISLNQEEKDPISYFSEILESFLNYEVIIYMYNRNTGYKKVNTVLIKSLNGELLGCDLAYGQLHEFPKESSETYNNLEYNSNINLHNKENIKHKLIIDNDNENNNHVKSQNIINNNNNNIKLGTIERNDELQQNNKLNTTNTNNNTNTSTSNNNNNNNNNIFENSINEDINEDLNEVSEINNLVEK